MASYQETVRFLFRLGNEVKSARMGLGRLELLLDRLGRPEVAFRSVHIAGTNGKGSTAAMIEAGLRAAGYRTGLYTSPHLVHITERIQVNGGEIAPQQFCAVFQRVSAAVEQLLAEGQLELHPTYFECLTAMAFCHFQEAGVEIAVLEVGLGGRLDATNVVRPEVAVITAIDFDHEAFLGNRAEWIAAEKAGILKRGVAAVFARQGPRAARALEARARELGILPVRAGEDWRAEDVHSCEGCYRFVAAGRQGRGIRAELSLAGEHQVGNALAAIATLDLLGVDAGAIECGLRKTRWPGRLERVGQGPLVLLDGAHNPAGARALAQYLRQHQAGRRIWLLYAALRDKAVEEVAGILFPCAHRVLLPALAQSRALTPRALKALVAHHHHNIEEGDSLAQSLALARARAAPADIIVVTGSLFLVGEAKEITADVEHRASPVVD